MPPRWRAFIHECESSIPALKGCVLRNLLLCGGRYVESNGVIHILPHKYTAQATHRKKRGKKKKKEKEKEKKRKEKKRKEKKKKREEKKKKRPSQSSVDTCSILIRYRQRKKLNTV